MKKLIGTMMLVLFVSLTGCTTSGRSIFNGSWQHPTKTGQERQEDIFDCKYKSTQMAHSQGMTGNPFQEGYNEVNCMESKGYQWD